MEAFQKSAQKKPVSQWINDPAIIARLSTRQITDSLMQKNYDTFLSRLEAVASLQPEPSLYFDLAHAIHNIMNIDDFAFHEAREEVARQGLVLFPNNPRLHYELASALEFQCKYQEAIASYETAQKLGDSMDLEITIKEAREMMERNPHLCHPNMAATYNS